jgi:DNA ligase-1
MNREVWEVACAEITISPISIAALGEISGNRGLSVRFPRFVRIREDKRVEDATRSVQLAELWRKRDGTGRSEAKTAQRDDGELVEADLEVSEVEDEMEDDDEG